MHERFIELEQLLSRLHDGVAEPAEVSRVEELLDGDPEACEFYIDYAHLVADVEREVSTPLAVEVGSQTVPLAIAQSTALFFEGQNTKQILNPSWRPLPWFAAAAAIILFAGSIALFFGKKSPILPTDAFADEAEVQTDNGVAILMSGLKAVYGEDGLRPDKKGGVLSLGELQLSSGVVEIEFYSGARLLVEGPSVVEFQSEDSAILHEGLIRAQVPPQALGFTITTPQVEVVDLGTEFGIRVTPDRLQTEVHCFSGKLEAMQVVSQPIPTAERTIAANEGLRYSPSGVDEIAADFNSFVSFEDMALKSETNASKRQQSWQQHMYRLLTDPAILALYTFEEQDAGEREVVNQAAFREKLSHGAIVGCRWTNGRWGLGKGALEFKRRSDRVSIQPDNSEAPPSFAQLSFATWVRIDNLRPQSNAILTSTDATAGSVDWSVTQNRLTFSVQVGDQAVSYESEEVFDPMAIGQWHHLATVYDSEAGIVTHFLDGQEIWQGEIANDARILAKLGAAEIGNYGGKGSDGKRPIRNLTGRIDEFAIFGRALTAEDIAEIVRVGSPE